jgi:hypothetical protein
MRPLIAIVVLAALVSPASAQPYRDLFLSREASRAADAQALRTRDVQLTNDLSTLQARIQTDQTVRDLAAARASPPVPTTPFNPKAPPPQIDASQMTEIPDAALADSNAKVLAAAGNRR